MAVLPTGFLAKLLKAGADNFASSAASVGVEAAKQGNAAVLAAATAACVGGLIVQSFVESKGEAEAAKIAQDRFSELLNKSGGFERALDAIATDGALHEMFSADRAGQLLDVMRASAARADDAHSRHEELLLHVGRWLEAWCGRHDATVEGLIIAIAGLAAPLADIRASQHELLAAHTRTSDESRSQSAALFASLEDLRRGLAEHVRPKIDAHARIERAVEQLKSRSFDTAIFILHELKEAHWPYLSPRERFRTLANLGHAYERGRDDFGAAAALYEEAAAADPSHEHSECYRAMACLLRDEEQQAREMARRAVERNEHSGLAHAVRVRTLPDDVSFADAEASVPPDLRGQAEVATALAFHALRRPTRVSDRATPEELHVAERYLRLAHGELPGEPAIGVHLGTVIVESERQRAFKAGPLPTLGESARAEEAVTLLSGVLDGRVPAVSPGLHTRALAARGAAYHLLDRDVEAARDISAAYGRSPDDPEILFQHSLLLHNRGMADHAIDGLGKLESDPLPRWGTLTLCRMLLQRARQGDAERAERLLRGGLPALAPCEPALRLQWVDTLIRSICRSARYDDALAVLQDTPEGVLEATTAMAFRAVVLKRKGSHAPADAEVTEAANAIRPESTLDARYLTVGVAADLGRDDLVYALLDGHVPRDRVLPETQAFLMAAHKQGNDAAALSLCAELREAGAADWATTSFEAELASHYNSADRAVSALQWFLSRQPTGLSAKLARLQLSEIGLLWDRPELIEREAARLPAVDEAGAGWGSATVEVLRQVDPTAAMTYAYRLLRLHPGKAAAHRAIVSSINPSGQTPLPPVPVQERVAVDLAVQVRLSPDGEERWFVIESEPEPDFDRGEISPTHPLARRMLGLGVGSTFEVDRNPLGTRSGTIVQIVNKHGFRAMDSMDHYAERFPSDPFFAVSFRAVKDDGSVDLGPIQRSVDQRQSFALQVEQKCRSSRYPISALAVALNQYVLDVLASQIGRQHRHVCCYGGHQELVAVRKALAGAETIVLDPCALVTLYYSKTYVRVQRPSRVRLVVSAGVVADWREFARRLRTDSLNAVGHFTKVAGRLVMVAADREAMRLESEAVDAFLDWLKSVAKTEDGLALLDVPPPERRSMAQVVGRATAETLALARKPGHVLWTDDANLAICAGSWCQVHSAWSQPVLDHLIADGAALPEAADGLALWMIRANYFFVRMSPGMVAGSAARSEWRPQAEPLRTALRLFGVGETEERGLIIFAGGTLRLIWQRAPSAGAAEVTEALLDMIALTPRATFIIAVLNRQVLSICWPDAGKAVELRLAFERWWVRRRWESRSSARLKARHSRR
jgi:tetratricopeptide (TPR) repeat protein